MQTLSNVIHDKNASTIFTILEKTINQSDTGDTVFSHVTIRNIFMAQAFALLREYGNLYDSVALMNGTIVQSDLDRISMNDASGSGRMPRCYRDSSRLYFGLESCHYQPSIVVMTISWSDSMSFSYQSRWCGGIEDIKLETRKSGQSWKVLTSGLFSCFPLACDTSVSVDIILWRLLRRGSFSIS